MNFCLMSEGGYDLFFYVPSIPSLRFELVKVSSNRSVHGFRHVEFDGYQAASFESASWGTF